MIKELNGIDLFDEATDDELEWIIAHSSVVALQPGEYFAHEGQRVDRFFVVLEGEMQITRMMEGQPVVLGTTPRGVIGNEIPLLQGTPSPSDVQAIVPTRLLVFDAHTFRKLVAACPTVGIRVLRTAAERLHSFAGLLKQQEKMAALGKLSAGLAHELNNPAAAARRSANSLREALPRLQELTMRLCGLGLEAPQFDALLAFERMVAMRPAPQLAPLERSDREDALGDWLDAHGVAEGWDLAPTFVNAAIDGDELAAATSKLPPDALPEILRWLHQALCVAGLLDEIEQSSARISDLVGAVKSYTYMDQAGVQEIDLHAGIDITLKVLHHKLKNVNLLREYDPRLPRIMARGNELNQVWTNLLDNAIHALGGNGTIRVITRHEQHFVMVEIADDGPGIAPEVLPRIFEPFFTTKDVGTGTGLGLDISYRIIKQHNGTIEVQSRPGQTRFIVRLPVGTPKS